MPTKTHPATPAGITLATHFAADDALLPVSTPLLDSLITPATLAERLGTTERNLSEWRITGRGPKYIRVGRSPRYIPESVDAWLRSQQFSSTAEELR